MSIFRPTGKRLLAFQILAHLSLIPMILYATWWQWFVALIVYTINALGLTVTLHRLVTHSTFNCNKWVERFLVILSTIGVSSSALCWTALHRKHHRYSDSPKDPHSPHYKGFSGLWLIMLHNIEMRYVANLLRRRLYIWQHDNYFAIILAYAILLFLISPFAVVYAFLVPAALFWTASACLNYFGHDVNHAVSRNSNVLKIIMMGEGYHDNHHKNQGAKRFGKYDIGYFVIRLLERKETA